MQSYHLSLLIDKNFDTMNRVLNKFCGKGFRIESMQMNPGQNDRTAIVQILLHADRKHLEILTKKVINYIDVHQLLELSEKRQLKVV